AITGILWWPEARRDPDRWFLVYGAVWLTMFVGTHLSQVQTMVSPVVVQASVPVLGWAFWWAARRLCRDSGRLTEVPAVVGRAGAAPVAPAADPGPAP